MISSMDEITMLLKSNSAEPSILTQSAVRLRVGVSQCCSKSVLFSEKY